MRRTEEGLSIRFYEALGAKAAISGVTLHGESSKFAISDLAGKRLSEISAYRIGEIRIA